MARRNVLYEVRMDSKFLASFLGALAAAIGLTVILMRDTLAATYNQRRHVFGIHYSPRYVASVGVGVLTFGLLVIAISLLFIP